MKLAEALQERADLNRNIAQLKERLEDNSLVQDGETANENPAILKQELDANIERLAYLITRINLTNCLIKVNGKTLTEIIAQKDTLTLKIKAYKDIVRNANQHIYRVRGSEIKIFPAINISEWQSMIDNMAKELRLLDNLLQEKNWTTDLIE